MILAAELGAGVTGGTLGSEGIAGERGALGISSKAGVRAESPKKFQFASKFQNFPQGRTSQTPIL